MKNNINALIMEAMKNHDAVRTESLRAIKSAFLTWQTSKENAGKELTEDVKKLFEGWKEQGVLE